MFWGKPVRSVTADNLNDLLSAQYREDQHLDYKQALPDLDGKKPDDARKKLLVDVAAFANAGGGDILFGVEEGRDDRGGPNGIPVALPGIDDPNVDAIHRRWAGIVESGIDPRLTPKLDVHAVSLPGAAKAIVILRVPRSFVSPHMVKETGRFHVRHGPENRTLDTTEIRAAFLLSEAWGERVRRFRDERVARILSDDTPAYLGATARLVVHIVPFTVMTKGFTLDLHAVKARNPEPVAYLSSYGPRFNADGLALIADRHEGTAYSYTQFFRDGSVESSVVIGHVTAGNEIHVPKVEDLVLRAAMVNLGVLQAVGAAHPFAVTVSLVNVCGFRSTADGLRREAGLPLRRDLVCLPDLVLEAEGTDLHLAFRSTFEAAWQAFGIEHSPSYGPDGNWQR